jgi:hypothetical protein
MPCANMLYACVPAIAKLNNKMLEQAEHPDVFKPKPVHYKFKP